MGCRCSGHSRRALLVVHASNGRTCEQGYGEASEDTVFLPLDALAGRGGGGDDGGDDWVRFGFTSGNNCAKVKNGGAGGPDPTLGSSAGRRYSVHHASHVVSLSLGPSRIGM